jgi:hypothetical protein
LKLLTCSHYGPPRYRQKFRRHGSAGATARKNCGRCSPWMKEETRIQVHGVGLMSITFVDQADDPRNK